MKTKRINVTTAKALAEQALKKISEKSNSLSSTRRAVLHRSEEMIALKKILKSIKESQAIKDRMVSKIEEKYNVNLWTTGEVKIFKRSIPLPKVSDLKNRIIIANHVNGVDPSKLIDYAIKTSIQG